MWLLKLCLLGIDAVCIKRSVDFAVVHHHTKANSYSSSLTS